MTELQRSISIDFTDPVSTHAGVQAICDHITAAENANLALALTIGALVSAIDRVPSGNAGEMVLTALDSLGEMGLGSPVLEAMRAIILKLAPTPPDGGTRLTIVRADGGERKAA